MEVCIGTIIYYDSVNHLANVRLWGSHPTVLSDVPVANDISTVNVGDQCVVVVVQGGDAAVVVCLYG